MVVTDAAELAPQLQQFYPLSGLPTASSDLSVTQCLGMDNTYPKGWLLKSTRDISPS